jgi:hypothetical protein
MPMTACTVVVLPMPLRPIRVTDLAGVDLERHAEQRLAGAVETLELGDAQHHASSSPR